MAVGGFFVICKFYLSPGFLVKPAIAKRPFAPYNGTKPFLAPS